MQILKPDSLSGFLLMSEVPMTHKEIIGKMDLFLNDRLSPLETSQFLRHLRNCGTCSEELEVRLLVRLADGSLQTASSFNLGRSMEEILLKRRRKVKTAFLFLCLAVVLLLLAAFALFIFL